MDNPPLRSVHSPSFPELLRQVESSLLVTTYQAGKLVMVRADGTDLNTHFRSLNKPMGLAVQESRVAIGTALEVWEYHNVPAVAPKLEPIGKQDACYLPRKGHVTGDVQIHEMEWVGDELWFVNTRFSCLCTIDGHHSFVPRWRPPFISGLAPEDRCHLNGMGLRGGQVRYVTALGHSDEPAGWRDDKKNGGILMDVVSNEILLERLSMPHSPRWHNDRLWLLESGAGTLGYLDERTGTYEPVAEMPGFTRGMSFHGPYAFVGLSQVRESAVFSGIPITERVKERMCGVCAVDLRTGEVVALLRFEDAVQEIFAVEVLPGIQFPELLNDNPNVLAGSFVIPDEALPDVPGLFQQSIPA